jgi:hypothetical protein
MGGELEGENKLKKYKLSFWRKINIVQTIAFAMDYVLEKKFTNPNLNLNNILVCFSPDIM